MAWRPKPAKVIQPNVMCCILGDCVGRWRWKGGERHWDCKPVTTSSDFGGKPNLPLCVESITEDEVSERHSSNSVEVDSKESDG